MINFFSIPSYALQRIVEDFTLSQRAWTAFPAHKIEHILRFYHILPDGWYYSNFDVLSENAIFGPGGNAIADYREKEIADNLRKFLNQDDLLTQKVQKFIAESSPTDDPLLLPHGNDSH